MPNLSNDVLAIEVTNLHKWFGDFLALDGVNLKVKSQEKVFICGPSGSGKSTLIRCFNFLERPQKGEVRIFGETVTADKKHIRQIRQKIGMIFQQFNLFPHLTVLKNMTLALQRVGRVGKKEAKKIALEYLDRVYIADQADKFPDQLSGGQQQRVAIARSLCLKPSILLLDEPTSALDPEMIQEVLEVLEKLAKEGMSMVCVTHEMGLARQVADRIVFMDAGKVIETSAPEEFFSDQGTERKRSFLRKILRS